MSINHYYSQTVADGTATSVVRPSDWNSVHNMVLNIAGNTAGTSQISGSDIIWAGGNNVTLSANGSTVTIIGPNTVAQTVQTQASGNIAGAGFSSTTTAGTAVVATHNSAGLSMGVPQFITTYVNDLTSGRAGTGFTSTTTAGTAVVATQNTAGLSMGVPAFLTTAAQSNHSHNLATTTTNGSQIVIATTNSAGATMAVPPFITTYVGQTTQTQPAGNIAGVGTTFGGTNVSGSMTLNSNGLALSLSAPTPGGGGAINVSAGTTSGNLQTIQFNNANGVSFGLNGSTVTASVNAGGGGTTVSWYPPLPLPIASSTMVTGTSGNTGGSFQTTAHLYVAPMQLQQALTFGGVEIIASHGALSAGTGSVTIGHQIGIYSLNGGTALSRISSFQWNCVLSQSSATAITAQFWWGTNSTSNSTGITGNSSASITGPRVLKLYDSTGSLPAGDYWIAQAMTHRSSSVNIAASWFTGMFLSQSQSTAGASYFGNSTIGSIMRNIGIVSTTQNNANSLVFQMPSSIHTSAITGTGGTSQMRIPVPRFYVRL